MFSWRMWCWTGPEESSVDDKSLHNAVRRRANSLFVSFRPDGCYPVRTEALLRVTSALWSLYLKLGEATTVSMRSYVFFYLWMHMSLLWRGKACSCTVPWWSVYMDFCCVSLGFHPPANCLGWPFEGIKLWLRVALILIKRGFSARQSWQRHDIRARRRPRKITGYLVVTLTLLTQVKSPSGYRHQLRVLADNFYGISAIGPVIKIKKSGSDARLIRA